MRFLIRLLLSTVAIVVTAWLLPGVYIEDYFAAFILAVILALLNMTVKPVLIILTIPFTLFTLGLFLLVINALVILLAEAITPGFEVDNFWWALLFSLILSIFNSLFEDLQKRESNR